MSFQLHLGLLLDRPYRIPFNHIAFLGIAKLIQSACAHYLHEWIRTEHKPLALLLFWICAAGGLVLLLIERPWSKPGMGTWKVKTKNQEVDMRKEQRLPLADKVKAYSIYPC